MKLPRFSPRPRRLKPRRQLFLIRRVTGESMLPTLAPGKVVLAIWPIYIRPGDIVIIMHDGLEKIKRVKYVTQHKVFVVGDAPGKSTDSRSFGWLDKKAAIATVIWPRML